MTFKLTFTPDKKYYEEAYDELISITKLRKWEPIFAIIMTLFGIGLYYFDERGLLGILPFFFIILGVYEFVKVSYIKRKWLKEREHSGVNGQLNEIEFNDEVIRHSGPFSNGEIIWAGFKEIKKTKKGIVLKPETGISLYLPDRWFNDNEEINFIMSKRK